MLLSFSILALLYQLSAAHFSVNYPYWRGDSFETQWERPCGGVNQSLSDTNRTEWPLDGGSLSIHGSHPWAYTFVNLALGGDNTTNFNITLIPGFNQTGNGTFCLPKITLPADIPITDGTNASIQVIQVNEHGSALYNCADITFSSTASILSDDQCANSTGIGWKPLEGTSTKTEECASSTATAAASATPTGGAARVPSSSLGAMIICCIVGTLWLGTRV